MFYIITYIFSLRKGGVSDVLLFTLLSMLLIQFKSLEYIREIQDHNKMSDRI